MSEKATNPASPGSRFALAALLQQFIAAPESPIDEAGLREWLRSPDVRQLDAPSLGALLSREAWPADLVEIVQRLRNSPSIFEQFIDGDQPLALPEAMRQLLWEEVAAAAAEIIAGLDHEEGKQNGGQFHRLCHLAWDWGLDPQTYYQVLTRAGLPESRASEIKSVLAHCGASPDSLCRRFASTRHRTAWTAALKEARVARQSAVPAWQRAARLVVRLVLRQWQRDPAAQIAAGRLKLSRDPAGRFFLECPQGVLVLNPEKLAAPAADQSR